MILLSNERTNHVSWNMAVISIHFFLLVWAHETSLTPPSSYWMSITKLGEWAQIHMYVRAIDVSTIFPLDLGTVPTMSYFIFLNIIDNYIFGCLNEPRELIHNYYILVNIDHIQLNSN